MPAKDTHPRTMLRDNAVSAIIGMIGRGTLRPGEQLKEVELSENLRISRAPLREAFRILEREGLVEYMPCRGIRIVSMNSGDIKEIYDARMMIDLYCAPRVIEHITDRDIAELDRIMAMMMRAKDSSRFSEYNDRFHKKILTIAGNGRILSFLTTIENQMKLIMSSCSSGNALHEASIALHLGVMEALRERSLKKYTKAIKAHHEIASKHTCECWEECNGDKSGK